MKTLKQFTVQIDEVLTKKTPLSQWIHDFVHSDDPKFAGKSKKERIKMAQGAYYGAQNEEVKKSTGELKKACWKGYTAVGLKNKNGRKVPNCVPVNEDISIDEGKMKELHQDIEDHLGKHLATYKAKGGAEHFGSKTVETAKHISKLHGISQQAAQKHVNDYVENGLKEEVEINEASLGDHKGLMKYSDNLSSSYHDDKKDFEKAAEHIKSGDKAGLKKHLVRTDTDVRDKILKHVNKAHHAALGYWNTKEEVEINELSNNKLDKYLGKAFQSQRDTAYDLAHSQGSKGTDAERAAMKAKIEKRGKGMTTAIGKMMKKQNVQKEEVEQLDEIHPSIMAMAKVAGKQSLRAQADKHTEAAIKANKAGDDEKVKYHQAQVAKIKAKMQKEEVEQIDELSKGTLANYSQRAAHDVGNKMHSAGYDRGIAHAAGMAGKDKLAKSFNKDADKVHSKALTRLQGLKTAAKKLAKEEVELEESRAHKVLATFFKNRETAQRAFTGQNKPVEPPKEPEKKDEKLNKEGVSMLNFNDFLKEGKCGSMKKEELKGNQHKLDKNGNGKIDADDFKKLRGEEKDTKKLPFEPDAKPSKKVTPGKFGQGYSQAKHLAQKGLKSLTKEDLEQFSDEDIKEFMMSEDFEQLDEISKETLKSYIPKAARSSRIHGQISTEYSKASDRKKNPGLKRALSSLSDKYKKKAWTREAGIKTAVNKLTKEEADQYEQVSYKDIMNMIEACSSKKKMGEGKIDDYLDKKRADANTASAYSDKKKSSDKPSSVTINKGRAYGGAAQKDDEGDDKPEPTEKRGRGRPSGSKSGARQKGNGHNDGGIQVHNLNLPTRNNKF